MAQQLSRRSQKYVWLCVPSALSLLLACVWAVSIAPEAQHQAREETQWRRDTAAQKQRQEFLRENALETDFDTNTLAGFVLGQNDPQTIPETYYPSGYDKFRADQRVKLLDEFGGCIGFIDGRKLYLEDDNPGLCGTTPSEANDKFENSTHL